MSRYLLALTLAAIGLCAPPGLNPFAPPAAGGPPQQAWEEVEALIRKLGSEDFKDREEAARRLMVRDDAAPALRRALKSPDAEVASRAAAILQALARRESSKALEALKRLAADGDIDRAAELLVRWPKWDDEADGWQVMAELADRLLALEHKTFGKSSLLVSEKVPVRDFRRYAEHNRPTMLNQDRVLGRFENNRFVVRHADLTVQVHAYASLFVSSGQVKLPEVNDCIVFAGGPVDVEVLAGGVVVCDGGFTANAVVGCLIVARGPVKIRSIASRARIVSCEGIQLPPTTMEAQVREREKSPLGFVKFFDPARAGIVVEDAEGGVRVKEAVAGKAFARAGLRTGDMVAEVNGRPADTAEAFRRALRAALAEGREYVLKVRRDKQVIDVTVSGSD